MLSKRKDFVREEYEDVFMGIKIYVFSEYGEEDIEYMRGIIL